MTYDHQADLDWQTRKDRAQTLLTAAGVRLRRIALERAELDRQEQRARAECQRLSAILWAPLGSSQDVEP